MPGFGCIAISCSIQYPGSNSEFMIQTVLGVAIVVICDTSLFSSIFHCCVALFGCLQPRLTQRHAPERSLWIGGGYEPATIQTPIHVASRLWISCLKKQTHTHSTVFKIPAATKAPIASGSLSKMAQGPVAPRTRLRRARQRCWKPWCQTCFVWFPTDGWL